MITNDAVQGTKAPSPSSNLVSVKVCFVVQERRAIFAVNATVDAHICIRIFTIQIKSQVKCSVGLISSMFTFSFGHTASAEFRVFSNMFLHASVAKYLFWRFEMLL